MSGDLAVVGRFAEAHSAGRGGLHQHLCHVVHRLFSLAWATASTCWWPAQTRHPNDVHDTVHRPDRQPDRRRDPAGCGPAGLPCHAAAAEHQEDLLPGAILYLQVYFLGICRHWLCTISAAPCSAPSGETKKPLYILSFAGVLNILLNLFFVIVCNLDVAVRGAGRSAISQCVSAGLIYFTP